MAREVLRALEGGMACQEPFWQYEHHCWDQGNHQRHLSQPQRVLALRRSSGDAILQAIGGRLRRISQGPYVPK
jgi:hypothetical protein